LSLAAAGCATQPAQPDPFVSARAQVFERCGSGTPASARQALAGKLATVAGAAPTLPMLADRSLATPLEKQALQDLLVQREQCRDEIIAVHEHFGHAAAANVYHAAQAPIRSVYAALYGGEITFGEANRRFDEIQGYVTAGLAAYGRELDADSERRRIAAVQMLQQWNMGGRTTATNCVRVGAQLQCATR
jgi:hypothetical protein